VSTTSWRCSIVRTVRVRRMERLSNDECGGATEVGTFSACHLRTPITFGGFVCARHASGTDDYRARGRALLPCTRGAENLSQCARDAGHISRDASIDGLFAAFFGRPAASAGRDATGCPADAGGVGTAELLPLGGAILCAASHAIIWPRRSLLRQPARRRARFHGCAHIGRRDCGRDGAGWLSASISAQP